MRHLISCLALAAALPLAACHNDEQARNNAELAAAENAPATPAVAPATSARRAAPRRARPAPVPVCTDCGTVTAVEPMKRKGNGSGAGAVMGAIAGAVIGHQVGSGRGKDVATAGGAVAGGVAGHEAEKRIRSETYYHVTVRMQAGDVRTVNVEQLEGLSVGSKVKVIGENLVLMS
ncbi:MAG TPA: glycine zipper 2TM domain-containing protein [Candidatus Binatia bacterium]|nr:glycine zipper 2TM domain-containing protein [Candidatus Binatia bacterium]